jgi:hypothetical protein
MTATTASCSTSPSETPPSDTVLQGLRRTVSSPFEHALVTAMQAAQWKARSETSETRGADPSELAVGTGIEIERRCRVFDTPVDVTVCTGTVAPTASARMAIMPGCLSIRQYAPTCRSLLTRSARLVTNMDSALPYPRQNSVTCSTASFEPRRLPKL